MQSEYVSVDEAVSLFPGPITPRAIRHRIRHGINGVKLAAKFDGKRYWISQQDVDDFLLNVSNSNSVPVDQRPKLDTRYMSALAQLL